MIIRDLVKKEAQRLNKFTVKMADLCEQEFEGVKVVLDVLNETDVNGDGLMTTTPDGELMYRTDVDFIVIESGSFFPTNNGSPCDYTEQTTVTFVSTNREDILEDCLTLITIAKECKFTLENMDKLIQPLSTTGTQLTVVTAVFNRLARV